MKTTLVTVHFTHGLHARPAAKLVALLRRFRARISLRLGDRIANAGSLTAVLLLAATCNTQLEVQASGDDENAAIQAAEVFFQAGDENALAPAPIEPSADRQSAASG